MTGDRASYHTLIMVRGDGWGRHGSLVAVTDHVRDVEWETRVERI